VTPDGPSLPHASLIEQQAFLRRLARSLVADAHRAEDLAQDATLAALENAPSNASSLRGWLARVMRNRAINLGQSEERRRAREQAAVHREPSRSPDELEAHFQVQRRVMEAVDRLDEPYRTAILLRYYRDLTPTAIAAQLGVPVATVKSRLARALAQLREQLDDGETRGTHAWVAVLTAGLGELHRPAAATALAAGGVAMGVKIALSAAAGCGALVLGGWWLLRPEATPDERLIADGASAQALQPVSTGQEVAVHAPRVEANREPILTADLRSTARSPLPPAFSIALELRGWQEQDKQPATVSVDPMNGLPPPIKESRALESELVLDVSHLFVGVERRPSRLSVLVDHPAFLPARVELLVPIEQQQANTDTGSFRANVELVRARAIVTGTVERPPSQRDAQLRVAIFNIAVGPAREIESVAPDVEGRFRLRADGAERHAVVAMEARSFSAASWFSVDGGAPALHPETRLLTLQAGEERDLGTLVLGIGESIRGRVTAVNRSLPQGRVMATLRNASNQGISNLAWIDDHFELARQSAVWTDAGDFELLGLGPYSYALSARPAPHHSDPSKKFLTFSRKVDDQLIVEAPKTGVQLALDRLCVTVAIRGNGIPIAGAALGIHFTDEDGMSTGDQWSFADEDGEVQIELHPKQGLHLEGSDTRYGSKELRLTEEDLLASDHFLIDLEGPAVEPATLVVASMSGEDALKDLRLNLYLYEISTTPPEDLERARASTPGIGSSGPALDHVWVEPQGRWPELVRGVGTWTLTGVRAGHYLVCLYPKPADAEVPSLVLPDRFEIELPAGARVIHDWQPKVGGSVRLNFTGQANVRRVELLDSAEAPVQAGYSWNQPGSSQSTSSTHLPLSGTVLVQPALEPGTYVLRFTMNDRSTRTVPFDVATGRVTDVPVDLAKL
jgi:RNA polymerase sigma factor (sigma-70 family)